MSSLNKPHMLAALLKLKNLRKSLAEASYLRCIGQQRAVQQQCAVQSQELAHYRDALPQQQNAIFSQLNGQMISLAHIQNMHNAVHALRNHLDTLTQALEEREKEHQTACADTDSARKKLRSAVDQENKFEQIKKRNDIHKHQALNAQEESETDDLNLVRTRL